MIIIPTDKQINRLFAEVKRLKQRIERLETKELEDSEFSFKCGLGCNLAFITQEYLYHHYNTYHKVPLTKVYED